MFFRFKIRIKMARLYNKIKVMESDILKFRLDARIMNELYYCGRGDVDKYVNDWSGTVYFKIAACQRLLDRYDRKLMELDGVVGGNSGEKVKEGGKFLKAVAGEWWEKFFKRECFE